MQFAVRDTKLTRKHVERHPGVLDLRTGLGETALHYLAVENYADAVQLLIDLGAEVNVQNKFGHSALSEALQVNAKETVDVLQRAGAVANHRLHLTGGFREPSLALSSAASRKTLHPRAASSHQRHRPLAAHCGFKLAEELVDDRADRPVGAVAQAADVVAGHAAHAGGQF